MGAGLERGVLSVRETEAGTVEGGCGGGGGGGRRRKEVYRVQGECG